MVFQLFPITIIFPNILISKHNLSSILSLSNALCSNISIKMFQNSKKSSMFTKYDEIAIS